MAIPFKLKDLPILGGYDKQRFTQFQPEDIANWYLVKNDRSKKGGALYPAMGRKHINFLDINRLQFNDPPRFLYKTVKYWYVFEGNHVWKIDKYYNQFPIETPEYFSNSADIYFTTLVVPGYVLAVFTDGVNVYVHNEATGDTVTLTDPNIPSKPTAVIAFGNRIAICGEDSSEMVLSQVNLGTLLGNNVDPATCFTVNGAKIFSYEDTSIVNFAILHNTLYVFTQFTVSIWSNILSTFTDTNGVIVEFPWKKNTTYNFDYGLQSPFSLASDFGRLVWEGKNQSGIIQIMVSYGDQPKPISTKAIDVLLSASGRPESLNPFLRTDSKGFLYQYENTVFYRLSAGKFIDIGEVDLAANAASIEYNFDSNEWGRLIEKNGARCRVETHVFINDLHFVTVQDDNTVYQLSGNFYVNEIRNPDQNDPLADDAYIAEPFRYERITPIIAEEDYGEFLTDWVQIDFVWGIQTPVKSDAPFENTVYIVDEDGAYVVEEDGETFVIEDGTNTPQINEPTYNTLSKPHIELYFSDDGGMSYRPADNMEFSQLGVYSWRMRWYQLGASRNRVYKLIAVSPSPIVILGGIMNIRRSSAGAS